MNTIRHREMTARRAAAVAAESNFNMGTSCHDYGHALAETEKLLNKHGVPNDKSSAKYESVDVASSPGCFAKHRDMALLRSKRFQSKKTCACTLWSS